MPVPGLFSSFYWPGDGQPNTPPASTPDAPKFPFVAVFGGLFPPVWGLLKLPVPRERYFWEKYLKRAKGALIKALRRWTPNRILLFWVAFRLSTHPALQDAAYVVREVARDPRSKHPQAWTDLHWDKSMKDPNVGENMWRGLSAYTRLKLMRPELSGIEAKSLLELSYLAFKARKA